MALKSYDVDKIKRNFRTVKDLRERLGSPGPTKRKKPYEDKIMKIAKDQKKAKAEALLDSMKKRLERKRQPMQTGPRKITDRGPSRIMKPMPITPKDRERMKDRIMKPLPITPKDRERMKDRIMTPMKKGGAAKRGYGKAKR